MTPPHARWRASIKYPVPEGQGAAPAVPRHHSDHQMRLPHHSRRWKGSHQKPLVLALQSTVRRAGCLSRDESVQPIRRQSQRVLSLEELLAPLKRLPLVKRKIVLVIDSPLAAPPLWVYRGSCACIYSHTRSP